MEAMERFKEGHGHYFIMCSRCQKLSAWILEGLRLGKYVFTFLGDPQQIKDSISFQHTHILRVITTFSDSRRMDIPCSLFYTKIAPEGATTMI